MTKRAFTHGASAYSNNRCRCHTCRTAHAQRAADTAEHHADRRTLDHTGRLTAPVPANLHGKSSTYTNRRCRCRPCTTAHSAAAHPERTTR